MVDIVTISQQTEDSAVPGELDAVLAELARSRTPAHAPLGVQKLTPGRWEMNNLIYTCP